MEFLPFARRPSQWAEWPLGRWDSALWTGGLLLLIWLAVGRDLRGRRLATWLAVPALAGLALVFLAGPATSSRRSRTRAPRCW